LNELRKKAEKGIKWSIIDQIVKVVMTLLFSVVLARLIEPKEFGLYSLITISIGFITVFKDFGLGSSIIQKDNPSDLDINSVFWFNIILSAFITLLIVFGAYFASSFYREPKLTLMMQVMGFVFFIGSFGLIPDGIIHKELNFKTFFFRNLINTIFSGLIGVFFAYLGLGVWALIIMTLTSTIIEVIISFYIVKWKPKLEFSSISIKPYLHFSLPLLGENLINYWVRNVDNILIGKNLGEEILGYYSRAYNLMLLPVRQISGAINRVLLPTFSIIKIDKQKVWQNYSRVLSLTAFIVFPLMGFGYLFARELIIILYGHKWLNMVPIFKGLCFLGSIQSIAVYCGSIFSSQAKTYMQLKLGLFTKPLMIIGIVLGLYSNGVMGVVWGYTITSTITFFIESYFILLILNQNYFQIIKSIYKEMIITLIVTIVLSFFKMLMANQNNILTMFVSLTFGAFIYIAFAKIFNLYGFTFIKQKIYEYKTNN